MTAVMREALAVYLNKNVPASEMEKIFSFGGKFVLPGEQNAGAVINNLLAKHSPTNPCRGGMTLSYCSYILALNFSSDDCFKFSHSFSIYLILPCSKPKSS